MMNKKTEKELLAFVKKSLLDRHFMGQMTIGYLTKEASKRIKKALKIKINESLKGMRLVLESKYVRHVRNSHPEIKEMDYLLLLDLINMGEVEGGNEKNSVIIRNDFAKSYTCVEVYLSERKVLHLVSFRSQSLKSAEKDSIKRIEKKKQSVYKQSAG